MIPSIEQLKADYAAAVVANAEAQRRGQAAVAAHIAADEERDRTDARERQAGRALLSALAEAALDAEREAAGK